MSKKRPTAARQGASSEGRQTASSARRWSTEADFNPDYTYVRQDLRRIGFITAVFLITLVGLSFILN